jgi:hypothetical protein
MAGGGRGCCRRGEARDERDLWPSASNSASRSATTTWYGRARQQRCAGGSGAWIVGRLSASHASGMQCIPNCIPNSGCTQARCEGGLGCSGVRPADCGCAGRGASASASHSRDALVPPRRPLPGGVPRFAEARLGASRPGTRSVPVALSGRGVSGMQQPAKTRPGCRAQLARLAGSGSRGPRLRAVGVSPRMYRRVVREDTLVLPPDHERAFPTQAHQYTNKGARQS